MSCSSPRRALGGVRPNSVDHGSNESRCSWHHRTAAAPETYGPASGASATGGARDFRSGDVRSAVMQVEPSSHPAVKPYRDALVEDGIPLAQFAVNDVEAEYNRLISKGVTFIQPPTDVGPAIMAVFDDTCGNLIQIIASKSTTINAT